ncbi:MAG: acyl-CoA dehydrogenase, partial [Ilumatobacteraceae bacterium]
MSQPTVEQFQSEALAFLEANAPRKAAEKTVVWGEGSDNVSMFEEKDRASGFDDVRRACDGRQRTFDAGFGWITGPTEFGGRGLSGAFQRAYDSLESKFEIPNQSCFTIG